MKVAILVLGLCGVASADVSDSLPDSAIKAIKGCWRDGQERWSFQPEGPHGVVVIRTLPSDRPEAARARVPSTVRFDAKTNEYGFGAAGRIHGLMMVGPIKDGVLEMTVFSGRVPGTWAPTGNTMHMRRCD